MGRLEQQAGSAADGQQSTTPFHDELNGKPGQATGDSRVLIMPAEQQAESVKLANEAMAAFLQAPNKTLALMQLAPTFSDAINQSDLEMAAVGGPATRAAGAIEPDILRAEKTLRAADVALNTALDGISDEDKSKIGAIEAKQPTSAAEAQSMATAEQAILAKYPQVMQAEAAMHLAVTESAPVLGIYKDLEQKFESALSNCATTRSEFYAALQQGHGNPLIEQKLLQTLAMIEVRKAMGLDPNLRQQAVRPQGDADNEVFK
ncbi:MAG TPA: hypothetical protein V6C81_09400 [Planktothrix sp.]